MATAKKSAATPAKKSVPAKAAQPATKKAVATSKPAAKSAAVSSNKKAVATKPVEKATAAKAPAKKTTALSKTATKTPVTSTKPAAKAAPKKAEPAAPAKKTVAAKPVVAKKAEAPAKVITKKVAVKEEPAPAKPVAKKVAPAAPAPAAKSEAPKAAKAEKTSAKAKKPLTGVKAQKVIAASLAKQMPAPKPSPAPAAYIGRDEKKSNVIIAHRRLESKVNTEEESGKTMINYQPDFTRSILGGGAEEKTGPVYRYSDEELNEFRELIQSRLEAARKELTYQQGLITRKDEAGTEDTENRYMNMEDGSGAMEREQLAQLASRQIQFINHLEKALIRIENKTYGICRVTGNLIDKARLRAVPHATLSIEAKKMMNNK